MFQYLARDSRLETFIYKATGLRLTRNLIQPTISTLRPGQTIFDHLTNLGAGIDAAAAQILFPRMPTISSLTLYIDRNDDIVSQLALLPQLGRLCLVARANVALTTHYLRGLQNLRLGMLEIYGEGGSDFNGLAITVNDIDTVFGSHATLQYLRVAWRGDTGPAGNLSFLQYSPHLLVERVITRYPALETLELPDPCGVMNLRRLPALPLNSNVRYLSFKRIQAPRANMNTHGVR
ncbi:hypothetical protein QM012_005555 [Aureobasidium pullulans]|uniref:L domain-like protein n=1 Tax=Aureobasidium pullulans TaxID=5580 RepID=A0ABR0T4S5_AURPU